MSMRPPHDTLSPEQELRIQLEGAWEVLEQARDRQAVAAQLVEGFGAGRVDRLGSDLDTIAERLQQMVEAARSSVESA